MSSLLYPRLLNLRSSADFLNLRSGDKRSAEPGTRRKSITLPVLPTYLVNMAQLDKKKKLRKRKGVQFPVGVLMQQAITEGDVCEIKQLMNSHGTQVGVRKSRVATNYVEITSEFQYQQGAVCNPSRNH